MESAKQLPAKRKLLDADSELKLFDPRKEHRWFCGYLMHNQE
jgi:hypothetical protein